MLLAVLKKSKLVTLVAVLLMSLTFVTCVEAGFKSKVAGFVGYLVIKRLIVAEGRKILLSRAKVAGLEEIKGKVRNNPWLVSKAEASLAKALNSKAVRDKFSPSEIAQIGHKFQMKKWSQEGADKIVKRYFDDIEAQTGRQISTQQRGLVWKNLHSSPPQKISQQNLRNARDQFAIDKPRLIKQWEKEYGAKWPKEPNGRNYDAHHIVELNVGGKNAWWNLTPAKNGVEHQGGIHRAEGVASNLRSVINSGISVVPK